MDTQEDGVADAALAQRELEDAAVLVVGERKAERRDDVGLRPDARSSQ